MIYACELFNPTSTKSGLLGSSCNVCTEASLAEPDAANPGLQVHDLVNDHINIHERQVQIVKVITKTCSESLRLRLMMFKESKQPSLRMYVTYKHTRSYK